MIMSLRYVFLICFSALVSSGLAGARDSASSARKNQTGTPTPANEISGVDRSVASGIGRLDVPTGPRAIVARFFATLEKGDVDRAYSKLTEGSKISQNAEQSELIRKKTAEAIEAFGQIRGSELVEMEWAGTHLVRMTYISLGENFPLRWRFYFYQRQQAWRLVDIRVDDSLKDFFHERGSSQEGK
jgi:hypothetical protein